MILGELNLSISKISNLTPKKNIFIPLKKNKARINEVQPAGGIGNNIIPNESNTLDVAYKTTPIKLNNVI